MSRQRSEERFVRHDEQWRDPAEVVSGLELTGAPDPALLRARARGRFWDLIDELRITLLVTREYEHLAVGLTMHGGRPRLTALTLPHPSGLAVDVERGRVHVASTRNPNQIVDLAPARGEER